MLGGTIPRPYDDAPTGAGRWIDTLGHDSLYDYDPLWRRCEELGVAPTFHSGAQGAGWAMWGLLIAAAVPLFTATGPRLAWAARGWMLALLGWSEIAALRVTQPSK